MADARLEQLRMWHMPSTEGLLVVCPSPAADAVMSTRQSRRTLLQLLHFDPMTRNPGEAGYGAGSGKPDVMFGFLKHVWSTGDRRDAFQRCAPCWQVLHSADRQRASSSEMVLVRALPCALAQQQWPLSCLEHELQHWGMLQLHWYAFAALLLCSCACLVMGRTNVTQAG